MRVHHESSSLLARMFFDYDALDEVLNKSQDDGTCSTDSCADTASLRPNEHEADTSPSDNTSDLSALRPISGLTSQQDSCSSSCVEDAGLRPDCCGTVADAAQLGSPAAHSQTAEHLDAPVEIIATSSSSSSKDDVCQPPSEKPERPGNDSIVIVSRHAKVGDYFKTDKRVLMRLGESLDSPFIGYCPRLSLMLVLEMPASKNSRRIRVCEIHGVEGWVSLHKECGEQLLSPCGPTAVEMEQLRIASREVKAAAEIEQLQTASREAAHLEPQASKNATGRTLPDIKCDKCDGPHPTDKCPFFKKSREDHKDSWVHYGDRNPHKMGADGGNTLLRNARVVHQPGDGSCLFHSLIFGLLGGSAGSAGHNTAMELRRDLARFVETHQDLKIAGDTIDEWVKWDQNMSARAYAQKMAHSGWGGGIEMACFSIMKAVNVHVYENARNAEFKRISCFDVPHAQRTVHVLYQGGVHYDALVPAY